MNNKSFFNEFKNSLKEDCGDLGGRYFAKVLVEVIKENPWLLSQLYDGIPEKVKIEDIDTEEAYKATNGKNRRTDLVVYYTDKSDKYEKLNVEIKWKDEPLDNQICDYINKVEKEENEKFLLLSLDDSDFKKDDLDCIDKSGKSQRLTCPQLYERIRNKKQVGNNWLIQQFLNFLKENAMIYTEEINRQALIRFMKNTIGWDHNDGFGRNAKNENIDEYPEMLHVLLSNIHKVSMDIYENKFEGKKDKSNNRPYTDFFVETHGAKYRDHQAGYFACHSGDGANEGKFIIQSRFKKGEDYYSYGIYFYIRNVKKSEKTEKNTNTDTDEKQPKYEISLYTFANIYSWNGGVKKSHELGYNEQVYKKINISELNKDRCINFPKMEVMEEAIWENIQKAQSQVNN